MQRAAPKGSDRRVCRDCGRCLAAPHKATCDKKPEHTLWLGLAESSYIYYAR